MIVNEDHYYLCVICGDISPFAEWKLMKWDDEHENLIPSEDGYEDPICVCPGCNYAHADDDGSGIYDGTKWQMYREKRRLIADGVDFSNA